MHQTQSQSKEELERQTQDSSKQTGQDFWGESTDNKGDSNLEVHEPESEHHSNDDSKADHADKPKSPIPTELDLINAERESIHQQIIETRQDEDLKQETKHSIIEVDLEDPKQPEPEPQAQNTPADTPADPAPVQTEDAN